MSEIVMLEGHESQSLLQTVVQGQAPAIMSYLSKDKWHVAKLLMKDLAGDKLYLEGCRPAKRPHPVNIRVHQPVGVSFKHAYGKFVFDTSVVALEPSADPEAGGTIVLAVPDRIGVVQRRSYFRVNVPESLKVSVVVWHRTSQRRTKKEALHAYFEGSLMDISAGGAQLIVPLKGATAGPTAGVGESEFRKGQFVGVRFTPMPYEMPLMFTAQIRSVLPTADHTGLCLGLQIVGLEASEEGREVLARLATVVDRYYRMNQSSARGQDSHPQTQPHGTPSEIPAGALQ
ncbi:MAG: PilZ domain-containing protein [Phycisphaerales bacterium]|nr:MAG: PilZ domain-containing protein [Phycisphaerales bacterium]